MDKGTVWAVCAVADWWVWLVMFRRLSILKLKRMLQSDCMEEVEIAGSIRLLARSVAIVYEVAMI